MAATVLVVDWEGVLAAASAVFALLVFRSWLMSPCRGFPRLRLERPARLADGHRVLVLAQPQDDTRHGDGTAAGIVIDGGHGPSEHRRATLHTRSSQ